MANKVMFESEEEFKVFMGLITTAYINSPAMQIYVKNAKEHNFLRKSPVEKAEEMYIEINQKFVTSSELNTWMQSYIRPIIEKQHEAIQYLKSEIERLKK